MGEIVEVVVPDIGEFDDVDVAEVLVSAGSQVAVEDPLITLESDKASMEVPAEQAGTVKKLLIAVGDKASLGTPILTLELGATERTDEEAPSEPETSDEASAAPAESPPSAAEESASPQETAPANAGTPSALPHASPSVRRFARQLGADLVGIQGTGRKGRILKEDVQEFVKGRLSAPRGSGGSALPEMPAVDFAKFGETEMRPLSRIKKLTGLNVHRSWLHVPHVTQFDEADITEMEAFRKAHAEEAKSRGLKLTPVAFLLKASVAALKEFPEFNSSLAPDGENLILKKYFNIGVAVDTPKGLMVPVIRDVDTKGLFELGAELAELSARTREGKSKLEDLQGGTFSISSLGGIGGKAFTPIVNAPEVAILGVSRSSMKPVYSEGEFKPRLVLPFSLSYDHRVIDGAQGARFTSFLSQVLSDIRRLLL